VSTKKNIPGFDCTLNRTLPVSKGVLQYTVALGNAIGKINEKKKAQTNFSAHFVLEK
jgi:hypothetical protein